MDDYRLEELWERHEVFDLLKKKYKQEVEDLFNWEYIDKELNSKDDLYLIYNDEETELYGLYITSVLHLFPSSKYHTPWCPNSITRKDILKDDIFHEALEEVLKEHNMFYQNGEGDALDIFFCRIFDKETE